MAGPLSSNTLSPTRVASLLVAALALNGCPAPRDDGDGGDAELDVRDAARDARTGLDARSDADAELDVTRPLPDVELEASRPDVRTPDCGFPFLPDALGALATPMASECCPEPNAHVDCFGGGSCRGTDEVLSSRFAPVYTCTSERAREYYAAGVCQHLGLVVGRCPPATRCDSLVVGAVGLERNDPRYPECFSDEPFAPFRNRGSGRLLQFWRLACSDGGPSIGSACRGDQDCRPAPASVRGRLACVERRCAEQPRPAPDATFGQACAPSTRPLGSAANCAVCATPVDGCGSSCTMACLFDEDCPDSYVCAYSSDRCGGACVPEGRRGSLGRAPGAGDGGVGATDAGAASCADGGGDR
ncbi:MAG: hypothetical protein JNK05_20860 [Myxococcales bacterium]|nr:hypothetical protein [Myxococcales bacterium]